MFDESTHSHGVQSIPARAGSSYVWRRIGPISILSLYWAVAAHIHRVFLLEYVFFSFKPKVFLEFPKCES